MNIKSQDLRIGNFVLDDEWNVVKIEMVQSAEFAAQDRGGPEFYFSRKGHDRMFMCSVVTGIPITEEILLKLGFQTDDGQIFRLHITWKGVLYWSNIADDCRLHLVDTDCKNISESEMDYVHQLQNIIYCLSGKELEINL